MQTFLRTVLVPLLLIQTIVVARLLVNECGTSLVHTRIMDGDDAEEEAGAWMAAIRNEIEFICGGTIIHRRFVLTAAHCIENQNKLFVMLGAYNKSNPAMEYFVRTAIMHLGYDTRTMQHDIGLLKLSRDIQFGFSIYPICISLNPTMKRQVENFNTFDAYGWGKTKQNLTSEILQRVELRQYDRRICDRYLRTPLTSNQLCAGSSGDTCHGDSGGPLTKKGTLRGEKVQIQLGIVSFGRVRCDGEGIYTDISSYANWIEDNINRRTEYEAKPSSNPDSKYRHQYVPPIGFASNASAPISGSRGPVRNRPPYQFSENFRRDLPQQKMFLFDECGGDGISLNLLVTIYGRGFEANGVMITDRYVLTNAKDLPSHSLEVMATNEGKYIDEIKVESIIKHPYFSGDYKYDLALLRLTTTMPIKGRKKPICILVNERYRQQAVHLSNWSIFNYTATDAIPVSIQSVGSRVCSNKIGHEIENDQICIEERDDLTVKYGQTGDILGTTMGYHGKDWYILIGIVSYTSNGLHILTNVVSNTDWIVDIVSND